MKTILLLSAAIIAGAIRYPAEGPIPVKDDVEADKLIDLGMAEEAEEASDEGDALDADDLADLTVPALKDVAEKESVDLGEATKKADILAVIRAHRARS